MSRAASPSRGGFTLIEMLAVLAMFALIAGLVLPRFTVGGSRAVRLEAEAVGEALEFARQRAIMTARPHEVLLDVDGGRWWVEWAPPAAPAVEAAAAAADARAAGSRRVDMTPPADASGQIEYEPVPGAFGRVHALDAGVRLAAVAFVDTTLDGGVVSLAIGADGVGDPAVVSLTDDEGRHPYQVEVEALADAVRVVDASR